MDLRKSNCPDCARLKRREGLAVLGERPAYWSDLDANGHVTNAVYGRIATDFLPAEYHSRRLRSFAINFHLEVHLTTVCRSAASRRKTAFLSRSRGTIPTISALFALIENII